MTAWGTFGFFARHVSTLRRCAMCLSSPPLADRYARNSVLRQPHARSTPVMSSSSGPRVGLLQLHGDLQHRDPEQRARLDGSACARTVSVAFDTCGHGLRDDPSQLDMT